MTSVNDNSCQMLASPGLTSSSNGENNIILLFSEWPINRFVLHVDVSVLLHCLAQWLEHSIYNRGFVSSSSIIGILTVNFSTGSRSSCVQ